MTQDDGKIWDEVARSVKPIKGRTKTMPPVASKSKVEARPPARKVEIAAAPAVKASLPERRAVKLRRGEIPVEATLDLHGMTAERAHTALRRFLGRARQKGWRCIEVITGRGDPARGTGKLRRELPLWLEEETGILHVTENPRTRGGSFLIMLRRAGK